MGIKERGFFMKATLSLIRKYESEVNRCDPQEKQMMIEVLDELKKTLKNDKRTKKIHRANNETST